MNPLAPILLPAVLGGGLLWETSSNNSSLSDAPSRARSPSPIAPMAGSTGSLRWSELSFRDYIRLLSLFHPETPLAERATFLFRLFNQSDDGCLREGEMRIILQAMVGDQLNESELHGLAHTQFALLDRDRKGFVTRADFERFLSPALEKATISIA